MTTPVFTLLEPAAPDAQAAAGIPPAQAADLRALLAIPENGGFVHTCGSDRLDAGLNPLMQKDFAHPMPSERSLQR